MISALIRNNGFFKIFPRGQGGLKTAFLLILPRGPKGRSGPWLRMSVDNTYTTPYIFYLQNIAFLLKIIGKILVVIKKKYS